MKEFYYTSLKVKADDMDHVNEVADVIRNMGYNVETNAEYLDSMKSQFASRAGSTWWNRSCLIIGSGDWNCQHDDDVDL